MVADVYDALLALAKANGVQVNMLAPMAQPIEA